jgi:hypothetical protein
MKKSLFITFMLVSSVSVAQDATMFQPSSVRRTLKSTRAARPVKVDGFLDDADWSGAVTASNFVQVEPMQGQPATQATEIRVLHDRNFLYFGVFSRDSLGKKAIRATDFKRDFNFMSHDLITLSFDGFNDNRNAMALAVNAYGVQRDLLSFDDLYYDVDWDGLWRVRTSRTDSGWVAEVAVPWQTLRYPKSADSLQQWGFNIYRNRRLTNEISAFSPFPRNVSSLRMAYSGLLTNLEPPPPRPNIRINPYVLASWDRYKNYSTEKPEDSNAKLGGELKWAVNPNAVLDLTVNTDFAQADADRQVNNITRFSVLFPERRQFFLENASLFGVGGGPKGDASGGFMRIQPFFSRRIGLDAAGNPIPIDVGARFVHRSGKRNYGGMAMRQRGTDFQDPTNFFIGRFSENFGKQNRLGGMLAVKNQESGTNYTSVLDGFVRLGQLHSLNAMLIQTTTTGPGEKKGSAGYAQYYFDTNQWRIWWTQSFVTKDFDPQLGFVSRSDVVGTTPGVNWYYRGNKLPLKKYIRAFEPSLNLEFYHQASTGRLTERQINPWPIFFNLQSGAYIGYGTYFSYQGLTDVFRPLGVTISAGDYNYIRHQMIASTDPSRKLNLLADVSWGQYFNGKLLSTDLTLQFAPLPHISLMGRVNRNHFDGVGEKQENKTVDLFSIEGRFALNARLQLIAFYQQNTDGNSRNYNIRFSWEYQPLSFLYIVLNKRGFDNLSGIRQVEDHAIGKIGFLRQI